MILKYLIESLIRSKSKSIISFFARIIFIILTSQLIIDLVSQTQRLQFWIFSKNSQVWNSKKIIYWAVRKVLVRLACPSALDRKRNLCSMKSNSETFEIDLLFTTKFFLSGNQTPHLFLASKFDCQTRSTFLKVI